MSGPERNSYFCFPESPDVSRDEVGITLKIIAFSLRLCVCVGVFIHEKENWRCFSRLLSRHFPPCFDHVP